MFAERHDLSGSDIFQCKPYGVTPIFYKSLSESTLITKHEPTKHNDDATSGMSKIGAKSEFITSRDQSELRQMSAQYRSTLGSDADTFRVGFDPPSIPNRLIFVQIGSMRRSWNILFPFWSPRSSMIDLLMILILGIILG